MRQDQACFNPELRQELDRKRSPASFRREVSEDGESESGLERDTLYYNLGGKKFTRLSGISGLDDAGDGRSLAILDFDRDGMPDIVTASVNAPSMNLFHNRMGDSPGPATRHRMVAVRLVGGNDTGRPSKEWSNRDGYGAQVRVGLDGLTLTREHRCGEGFAGQNSPVMLIGIGARAGVQSLQVRWPSGKTSEYGPLAAMSEVTVYENPAQSPTGQAFVAAPYRKTTAAVLDRPAPRAARRLDVKVPPQKGPAPRLRLYATMATWCENSRAELPQMQTLRATFKAGELAMFGVPHDKTEASQKLLKWARDNRAAYTVLAGMKPGEGAAIRSTTRDVLKKDGLPASILTDDQGRVLMVRWGAPTISEVRELLEQTRRHEVAVKALEAGSQRRD